MTLSINFVQEDERAPEPNPSPKTLLEATNDLLISNLNYNYLDGTYIKSDLYSNMNGKDIFYAYVVGAEGIETKEDADEKFFDSYGNFISQNFEEWGLIAYDLTLEELEAAGYSTVFEALFGVTSDKLFSRKPLSNNYVWFDGFLWRIMGINADGSIRMITEESVTGIPWGSENTAQDYDNSYVNDWLNNYFYSKLEYKDLLVNQTWCSQTTTSSDLLRTTCTNNLSNVQKPVGLLSINEYYLSGGTSSYLVNSQCYWTLTPVNDLYIWSVSIDSTSSDTESMYAFGIRPVINIQANVDIIEGNGTLTDPYIIEEVKDVTGNLKDNSHVGEYVTYAGRNYRVVETSNQGTKLILDGYYDSNNDGIIDSSDKMVYGPRDGTCTLCTAINEESFINWISNNNEIDKNKLVSTTWYRGDYFDYNDFNYKTNLESTSNPYVGKVGLIRVGEMLASQSETIFSKNHTVSNDYNNAQDYWTATPNSVSQAWDGVSYGPAYSSYTTDVNAVRPVIMIGPDVQILNGNGTFNSPYQI